MAENFDIQGVSLQLLAEQYGTPLYIYNTDTIERQFKRLKDAFDVPRLRIKYAAKALTNVNILKFVKSIGGGIDVVSINEAKIAEMAGFSAADILYTPNSVSFEDIVAGVEEGLFINIDNLSILDKFGQKYGSSVPCCVRINPNIMAGGNYKISTGHVDSKFGISIHQLKEIISIVSKYDITVKGLHVHTGSDILDATVFLKTAQIMFDAADHFSEIDFLDFGSGFKVAYKPGDVTTDIRDLGEKLSEAFNAYCKKRGKELELWFEPGKYLVSESGYFLVEATVIKESPSRAFVGVNSGLNHLIRPMLYDAHHEIYNISNPDGPQRVYNVVGYICETDTFAWDRALPEVREGDLLLFRNAGAYSYMMSSNYNSRPRPAEVMIYKGEHHLIRRRETLEDITRNQIAVDFLK